MAATLQQIFRDAFPAFAATRKLPAPMTRAAERIIACRTAALGGHVQSCPNGHVHAIHYNSCKHRSCPQCAFLEVQRWLARQRQRLLDCDHFHIIFTVPSELNPLWRWNKRAFARLLFRAVRETLDQLLGDERYLGAVAAMLAALHTWSQTLAEHPHLHVLVTAGGLGTDGRWRLARKSCLLPRRVLMKLFRGKLRALLGEAARRGELQLPMGRTLPQFVGLLNKLGRVHWNVKILDRYRHGRGVATYLARYLRGGPIGNRRLVEYRDGQVSFRYRDNRAADAASGPGRSKTMALGVHEFMRRVLEHVPPPGMHTVRSWGVYAASRRADLARARSALGQSDPPGPTSPLRWQDVVRRAGGDAATRCRVCGAELVAWGHFRRGELPPPLPALAQPVATNLHSVAAIVPRPPPTPRPVQPRDAPDTHSVSGCSGRLDLDKLWRSSKRQSAGTVRAGDR